MDNKIKVGVIFGGNSVEHEVSIISAVQAMNKMDKTKYDIIPIYITKDLKWYTGSQLKEIEIYQDFDLLKRYAKEVVLYKKDNLFVLQNKKQFFRKIITNLDIVFPIVHGANVEDGTLIGFLDTIGIPYVGTGVLGSSIGQDKVIQKLLYEKLDILTPKFVWFYEEEYDNDQDKIKKEIKSLSYPLIIKPATLGSSIGIKIVTKEEELDNALKDIFKYDKKVLVEELLKGCKEVNISVLGNSSNFKLSQTEEVHGKDALLSFDDKYLRNSKKTGATKGMLSTFRKIPANISKKEEELIKEYASLIFKTFDLNGVVRFDFLLNKGKVYMNEVNIIPGSLAFYLWEDKYDFSNLLDYLISLGIKSYKIKQDKITSFKSNILANHAFGIKNKLK